jgi:hypothetical protein
MGSDDVGEERIITIEILMQRVNLPDLQDLEIDDDDDISPSENSRISAWAEALLIGILSSLIASAIWWMSSQSVFSAT